jgi:hypothetical protein
MTISRIGFDVGTGDADGGALVTATGIANTQAGDIVYLFFKHEGASTTYTASDSASNDWSSAQVSTVSSTQSSSNGDLHCVMFRKVLTAGATSHTFTVTPAANRTWRGLMAVVHRSTLGGFTPVSGTLSTDGVAADGVLESLGNMSPSTNYCAGLGIGAYYSLSSGGVTPGSGWTEEHESGAKYFESRFSNSGGATVAGDFTSSHGSNGEYVAIMVADIESSGGGGGGGGGPATTYLRNQLTRSYRPRPFAPGRGR